MKKTTILLTLGLTTSLFAQDLKTTLNEVLSTNPVVQERLKNYNATKEDITTAKAGFYPKLDLSLGFGFENSQKQTYFNKSHKEVSRLKQYGVKKTSLNLSVYQTSLKYTQNLFAGFRTISEIEQQDSKTVSSAYSYVEKVNDISFKMVDAYLQVMRNKELLDTAKANVDINKEIFKKVQKLYDAGLTTFSEVNKVESSLSLSKSNYIVQENTLLDVKYNLQRVVGRYLDVDKMEKPVLNVALPATIEDAAQYAMQNNPSLLVAAYNIKLAQATYKAKKSAFYPKIDIELSQNMNSNLSGIQGHDNRFRAMAYLSYNLFNGFSDSAALQKSVSNIHKEVESKNDLRRQVVEGLNLSWAANKKLGEQIEHLKDYKKFSLKTLTLYAKEYDLGRRSLLDLLSAQSNFIEAKQQIINTEYSMLFAKYRILDAMGTLVTTVIGNTDTLYANVGLVGKTPENLDTLPISYDKDLDLVVDEFDICNNSLKDEMRSLYGCKFVFEDTAKIDRYTGFIFDGSDVNGSEVLSDEGETRLDLLIKQVAQYRFAFLKFDILGNVENDDLTPEQKVEVSKDRALYIKGRLIKAGALEENIVIHANSDKAPIYSDETSEGILKNNRADIIVRKLKKSPEQLALEAEEKRIKEQILKLKKEEEARARAAALAKENAPEAEQEPATDVPQEPNEEEQVNEEDSSQL